MIAEIGTERGARTEAAAQRALLRRGVFRVAAFVGDHT